MNPRGTIANLKNQGKGRPRGAKNKNLSITKVREMYLDAFERLGGVNRLVEYAQQSDRNYAQLVGLVASMLPKAQEINMEVSNKDLSSKLLEARKKAESLYNTPITPQALIEISNQGVITQND